MNNAGSPPRIGLATASEIPDLTDDDRLVAMELQSRGFEVEPAIWNGPESNWERYDLVILRSCWGYHEQPDEFLNWLATLERAGVEVWNRPETIRWNLHKEYLLELADADISIVPTLLVEQPSPRPLAEIRDVHGWSEVVLKPAISAVAHRTARLRDWETDVGQFHLEWILNHTDAIVQPFIPTIEDEGEWSLIFLGGEFSHSVKKYAKPGDYRVQSQFGGKTEPEQASLAIIQRAEQAIQYLDHDPLYARVDGIETEGEFKLMELELIEPQLFFRFSDAAASRFADYVTKLESQAGVLE